MQKLYPIYKENFVAISANSSDEYVPYLSVYLLSIKENASPDTNYDVVIFEQAITDRNKEILKELFETSPNLSLRFYNPSNLFDDKNTPVMHRYLCKESYFRLSAPIIFKNYKKVIFTDADLIFDENPLNLYNLEMNDNCILSAIEPIWSSWINSNTVMSEVSIVDYTKNVLKLKNPHKYFNTGVMLLDIEKLNEMNAAEKMLEKISSDTKYLYQDQCVINEVLQDKIGVLPFEWNGEIIIPQNYENANEEIKKYCEIDKKYILHWIGSGKPWITFDKKLTEKWWNLARKSPFYEIIIDRKTDIKVKRIKDEIFNNTKDMISDINEIKSIGSQQIKEKNRLKEEIIHIKDNVIKFSNEQNILKNDVINLKNDIENNDKNNILKNEIEKLQENAIKTDEINKNLNLDINKIKEDLSFNAENISKNDKQILDINEQINQSSILLNNTENKISDINARIDENVKYIEKNSKQILIEIENNNNLKEQILCVRENLDKTIDTVSSQKLQIDNQAKANNELEQNVLNLKNDVNSNFNELQVKIDNNRNENAKEIERLKEISDNLKTLIDENDKNIKLRIDDIQNILSEYAAKYEALKKTVLDNKKSVSEINDEIIKINNSLLKAKEDFNIKIEALKQENIKKLKEAIKQNHEKTMQETLLLYNFKHNRAKYNKYKILKHIVFGKMKQRYSDKESSYKILTESANKIIRGENE